MVFPERGRGGDRVYVAGIDLGSTTIKVVLCDGPAYRAWVTAASLDPEGTAGDLLRSAREELGLSSPPAAIAATGYGRRRFGGATIVQTEIACHARGASFLAPGCRTVIDVGGQDAKGIRLTSSGAVEDFVMNDRCAAGTGRFLSNLARALGVDVGDLGRFAEGAEPHRINSMCTVFAESEVIGLISQGVPRNAIIAGIDDSIARRIASMVAPLDPQPPVAFTGGVSANRDIAGRLGRELGLPVTVPPDAIAAGALGAALIAWEAVKAERTG
jgi:predicted CoA-substrate-specific enzyme activase